MPSIVTRMMMVMAAIVFAAGTATAQPYKEADVPEGNFVKMDTTQGVIVLELFPDLAPNHVKSFKHLISDGFYDGLAFHRVVPGFVVQGGDPNGDGTGGPGYTIDAEFSDRPHKRGALSMARTSDPNSAGSQFFIVLDQAAAAHLDGQYTLFGEVTSGMDTVDAIQPGDRMERVTLHDENPA